MQLVEKTALPTDAPIFSGLPEATLEQVAAIAEHASYPAGSEIFGEGEADGALFVLTAGEVSIEKLAAFDQRQTLHRLRPGSFFGETSFLIGGQHSASAVALADAEVVRIRRNEFDRLARRSPEAAYPLLLRLAVRVAQEVRSMDEKFVELVGYIWGRAKK